MRVQSLIVSEFRPNGLMDASTSLQNAKFNGIVIDFSFTPDKVYLGIVDEGDQARTTLPNGDPLPSGFDNLKQLKEYNATLSPYRVLKNIVLNLNYRDGTGAGQNALLVDRVNMYLLMEHSDFIAGLDISQNEMKAGKVWRACGHLGFGYISVSENASLDVQMYCKSNPEINSKMIISTELRQRGKVDIIQYRETKPTGASQTFENVLSAFITTDSDLNDTISTSDNMNNEVVNIEACIALSNAVGRFEKFKRYGQFYEDEYGVGQTLTFNCPNRNEDEQILLCCRVFNLTAQVQGDSEFVQDARALMSKIGNTDAEKFRCLQVLGFETYGVSVKG